jgi:polyketide synthase PksN
MLRNVEASRMSHSKIEPESLSRWCVAFVAEMLERPQSDIRTDVKLSRLGLDSAMGVQLAVALEQELGVTLEPDVVLDHPTIDRLVSYLCAYCASAG